jgi:DNA-binding GntR family transcriptional regulator
MEAIYFQLRNDVSIGKFFPGEHLSEKKLVEMYGVSRTKIREVLSQLSIQGFVTIEKNRGAVVAKLSVEDIEILFNIRRYSESYASRLFTERPDRAIIRQLETLHKKMQEGPAKGDLKTWIQLNDEFHKLIYTNCHSRILSDLVSDTRLRVYRYRMVATEHQYINLYNQHHALILSAIRQRQPDLVEKLMLDHTDTAKKHQIERLQGFSPLVY